MINAVIDITNNSVAAGKVEQFAQQFPLISFPAGEFLFHLQKVPDSFLFIKNGCVKVSQTTITGDSITIHILYEKSCVSLLSLIESKANYEFEALTNLEAYRIPRIQFIDFLKNNADISFDFLLQMLKGIDGLVYRTKQSATTPAYERVASLLIYFTKHVGSEQEKPIIQLALTHQDIAEWLGLTRENVSIQMKKLERAGLISKNKRLIEVSNLIELKKLADSAS